MGMFDYVKCEIQLPDNSYSEKREFQTKSFETLMETYVITKTGELYVEKWDWEFIEDENHLLKGYLQKINDSYRRIYLTDYHGDVRFYDSNNIHDKRRDYYARFTNGRLSKMWYEDSQY